MANEVITVSQVVHGVEVDLISMPLEENADSNDAIRHLIETYKNKEIGYLLDGKGRGVLFYPKQGPIKFKHLDI